MKSAFAFSAVAVVLMGLSGCCCPGGFLSPHGNCLVDGSCGHCADCPETCRTCDMDACGADGTACADGYVGAGADGCDPGCAGGCVGACGGGCGLGSRLCGDRYFNPGPPTAQVTYPYYTVRGPRDYFLKSPRPLGP